MGHWDQQAAAYDKLIGNHGDPLRAEFLDPVLMQLLGDVRGLKVLDAGCGNGYLTAKLQSQKAEVVGVDSSAELLKLAKQRFPQSQFIQSDLTQKLPFPDASFDLVVSQLVLMDLPQCDILIAESYRVLRTGARVVMSILHPLFTPPVGSFHRGVLGRLFPAHASYHLKNYFQTGCYRKQIYRSPVTSLYYHRLFSTYINSFLVAGFRLAKLLEPRPSREFLKKYPQYLHADRIPIFLLAEFKKTAGS